MNKKNTPYIYVLLLLLSFEGVFAQEFTLKITSKKKTEILVLNKIEYKKTHKDTTALNLEIFRISDYLKKIGYFTNTVDSLSKINKEHIVFFNLGKKIESSIIKIKEEYKYHFKDRNFKNSTVTIPVKELKNTLLKISKNLDNEGKSFSKVQLKNITIKDNTLFADLDIIISQKRTINKVIIKGYNDFPKSYLKNYFNIKNNTVFNQKKITEISLATNNLEFVSEIKKPEILFTRDSTLLYMYLKKHQNNSFDGIVSFASKENGDVLFNGNIDLELNNILNTGEKIGFFWNSIGEEKQELKLSTEIPYIFNTKFSPELSFLIYKQDSTFLNSKFDSKINYSINQKIKLALTYNSETSENLSQNLTNNIESYNNYFLGIQFEYNILKNDYFLNNKFYININPSVGNRKTDEVSTNQFKFESTVSYIWDLNSRNSIFIKNRIGYLNSDTYIDNELFRIGGANSIRGFTEQNIFTNNYTYFNIEYRYLTSEKSYFYTITDIGRANLNSKKENLLGLGLGYLFNTNNSQINLSLSVGKISQQTFDFKSIKLIINWKNYF